MEGKPLRVELGCKKLLQAEQVYNRTLTEHEYIKKLTQLDFTIEKLYSLSTPAPKFIFFLLIPAWLAVLVGSLLILANSYKYMGVLYC